MNRAVLDVSSIRIAVQHAETSLPKIKNELSQPVHSQLLQLLQHSMDGLIKPATGSSIKIVKSPTIQIVRKWAHLLRRCSALSHSL